MAANLTLVKSLRKAEVYAVLDPGARLPKQDLRHKEAGELFLDDMFY